LTAALLLALLPPLVFAFIGLPDPTAGLELAAGSTMYSSAEVAVLSEATDIPEVALSAYLQAAQAKGMDWTILAGVGRMECNHGQSSLAGCDPPGTINEDGARGPMQFLGYVWRASAGQYDLDVSGPPIPDGQDHRGYATDGDRDGTADPWSWPDATYAAARYLVGNGVLSDPERALFAYYFGEDEQFDPTHFYHHDVVDHAEQYRAVEERLLEEGQLSSGGTPGPCPVPAPTGPTEAITESTSTLATRAMANAVIQCFGRGFGVSCFDNAAWREDKYEHPRGRACDFMVTAEGMPSEDERTRGQAMAEWVADHAAELNVLYVIWYDRSWSPSDGQIPWAQWGDYGGCENPCTDPSSGHYNHPHVSVKLMPGDPASARCSHGSCTE
jgi:hypothetical protein